MPHKPTRPRLPALTLIALVLLTPTLAAALPQGAITRLAAERVEAIPSLFFRFWGFLSAVWANGSILEPDGTGSGASSGPGTVSDSGSSGDNGSGLEPNG